MAKFTAFSKFDNLDIYGFSRTVVTATPKRYDIKDESGPAYLSYTGNFTYSEGQLSGGSVNKITGLKNGEKYYQITGRFDALALNNAIDLAFTSTPSAIDSFVFSGNDTFKGSKFNDYFDLSGAGNDKISLGRGNDFILSAIDATSFIKGGAGDDFLAAYGTSDTLVGGAGNDIFRVAERAQGTAIRDFKINLDLVELELLNSPIELTAVLSSGGTRPDGSPLPWLKFASDQIAVGAGVKNALDGTDLIAYDTSTGKLYYDIDGVGGVDANEIVQFSNKPKFTAAQIAEKVLIVKVLGTMFEGPAPDFLDTHING